MAATDRNMDYSFREAAGKARDSIQIVAESEEVYEAFGREFDTEGPYEDIDLGIYDARIFSGDEFTTLYVFPGEEVDEELVYGLKNDDAELRNEYREELQPLLEINGSDEELGNVLEQFRHI